jgi:hypothetical protein
VELKLIKLIVPFSPFLCQDWLSLLMPSMMPGDKEVVLPKFAGDKFFSNYFSL